jgi:hypothetical protein
MTIGSTYNATVQGFNDNGLVVLSTFDGAKAIAKQTGNGELKPGQNVVLQRSGVPGVSDICFDPTATPTEPKVWPVEPEVEDIKANVWILYAYEGKLWVGGHQRVPEKVLNEVSQHQANFTSFTGLSRIWGNGNGWEATFYSTSNKVCIARSKRKSRALLNRNGINTKQVGKGLLDTKTVFDNESQTFQWTKRYEISYETFKGNLGVSEGISAKPDDVGNGGQNSYSSIPLAPPWSVLKTEFSAKTTFRGDYGNIETDTRSGVKYNVSFTDGTWALCGKVVFNYFNESGYNGAQGALPLSGGWTISALVTNGAQTIELGQVRSGGYTFTGQGDPEGLIVNENLSNNATFNFPVFTDTGPLTYTEPAELGGQPVTKNKYRHIGLRKSYKLKIFSVYNIVDQNVGGNAVAEVTVKVWGIPEEAVVLHVASWLPNAAKYTNL